MAYIYRACKYEEVGPVHCFYDWLQGGISGAEFFVFYYAGCAACTKMGKVLGKEKFCIFPADFFLEEFCNVVGRAFVALSVDYYCFHGVCSFFLPFLYFPESCGFCLRLSFVILGLIVLFFLVNLGGGAVFTF